MLMPTLFDPIGLGSILSPNRMLMAPLTRGRATRDHIPTARMATYYAQRASAGLIISEATGITQEGLGWPHAPGLWSDAQVEAWKPVVAAVHGAGGRIIAQLWHMGRLVHPSFLGGAQPVSSSATTAPGKAFTYDGKQLYTPARPLDLDEIPRIIGAYVHAARNAMAAGFDGVQLHGANGYLIDQFLRDNSNFRDDIYGGSIENRIRLLDDVTRALIAEVGAGRTSVRLSPNGDTQGADDSNPEALFTAAAAMLARHEIAFLELREQNAVGDFGTTDVPHQSPAIRKVFPGPLVLNQDYDAARAQVALDSGIADAISFGRSFLANPDLPKRIAGALPMNKADLATLYSQGDEGYTDYPMVETVDA
jgi:N-ethylmaleimide reductase